MAQHLDFLAREIPAASLWFKGTLQQKDNLVFFIGTSLARDPSRLPVFQLRTAMRWFATHLYIIGFTSAYIMRQMNHKYWSTSQLYVVTYDGQPAPWRTHGA